MGGRDRTKNLDAVGGSSTQRERPTSKKGQKRRGRQGIHPTRNAGRSRTGGSLVMRGL